MEHCADHSTLVETVSEIKGTVNVIKDSQGFLTDIKGHGSGLIPPCAYFCARHN
jgi:hypothetical protein